MNAIGTGLQADERRQINSRLAVRGEPHHFPFIAVRLKPEVLREAAVKKSNRVGKRNRQQMFEPAVASVPNRSSFPRPATIHYRHGSFVKPRIGVRTDGMG